MKEDMRRKRPPVWFGSLASLLCSMGDPELAVLDSHCRLLAYSSRGSTTFPPLHFSSTISLLGVYFLLCSRTKSISEVFPRTRVKRICKDVLGKLVTLLT